MQERSSCLATVYLALVLMWSLGLRGSDADLEKIQKKIKGLVFDILGEPTDVELHEKKIRQLKKMSADVDRSFESLTNSDEVLANASSEWTGSKTNEFLLQLTTAAAKLFIIRVKDVRISFPPKEASVQNLAGNKTHTQRYVHAPERFPLEVECSDGKVQSIPEFSWKRGMRRARNVSFMEHRKRGERGQLIFTNTSVFDSGNYFCVGKEEKDTHEHHVTLYVFRAAEVTVGVPVVFKSINCSKRETKELASQISNFLEKHLDAKYFHSTTNCSTIPWHNQSTQQQLHPTEIKVVVQLLPETTASSLDCDSNCSMTTQLASILPNLKKFSIAFTDLGTLVGFDQRCGVNSTKKEGESCLPSYVMKPLRSITHLQIVYTCSPGFIFYMTSSCKPCLPGSYSLTTLLKPTTDCVSCPPRHYQREVGARSCFPCLHRSVDRSNQSSSDITGADDSHFCDSPQLKSPLSSASMSPLARICLFGLSAILLSFCLTRACEFLILYFLDRREDTDEEKGRLMNAK